MTSSQRDRDELRERSVAAHAVPRMHQLRRQVEGRRKMLERALAEGDPESLRHAALELARQMVGWEEAIEQVRLGAAAVLAERDRWQVAHDKLRERMDRHTLQPRTRDSHEPPPSRTVTRGPLRAPTPPPIQDFTAIDRELERLNESMLRALSSSE